MANEATEKFIDTIRKAAEAYSDQLASAAGDAALPRIVDAGHQFRTGVDKPPEALHELARNTTCGRKMRRTASGE